MSHESPLPPPLTSLFRSLLHRRLRLKCDGTRTETRFRLTLVDLQLDAQNSYLFTYNTFIKILYMFLA